MKYFRPRVEFQALSQTSKAYSVPKIYLIKTHKVYWLIVYRLMIYWLVIYRLWSIGYLCFFSSLPD
jgi:hypothetical protein